MSIATPGAQAPPLGPLCSHQEPTVLADVNGRKMYRCSRFPKNHCNVCCPLEVALVPLRPSAGTPHASAALQQQQQQQQRRRQQQQQQQQQQSLRSTASMGKIGSPISPVAGSGAEAVGEQDGKTPSQEHRPPRLPAAPTKSSSVESRHREDRAAAQRSLDFNAISIQAIRARQLGAQYMVMRPNARQVARMQQLAAVTPAAAAGTRSTKDAGRKRSRDPASPLDRHPLQELTLGGQSSQEQLVQQRRQQQEQAPTLQPPAGSDGGTWLKDAAHRPY